VSDDAAGELDDDEWIEFLAEATFTAAALIDDRGGAESVLMSIVEIKPCKLTFTIMGEGDADELLQHADLRDVDGILLSIEVWAWPHDLPEDQQIGRPSEHPDSVKLRATATLMCDMSFASVVREPGKKPIVEWTASGPLLELMVKALQASEPPEIQPALERLLYGIAS